MRTGRTIVHLLLLAAAGLVAAESLKISAFNIQVFGRSKLSKTEVVELLKQIVRRYDIVLIQEIRDSTETTIPDFLNIINNGSSVRYEAVVSERLGRTSSKEQYAFLYRLGAVEVLKTYQHEDTEDQFEREPFSVLFTDPRRGEEFFLLGIHVKPSDVVNELEALGPAFQLASGVHGNSRGVIMGDLNAGCSYLSRSKYEELSLVKDSSFIWLLGYDADTTVASSTCSYDRFIVHESLNSSVVEGSAGVFNFTDAYSLTAGQAKNVSDHFPIEFQLELDSQASSSPSLLHHPPLLLTAGLIAITVIRYCLFH
ncbi:Deoxyribonuclease-1 [Geodia barretti]|uniref:Deoxyribonuclease n=1 Tax=Geodia barretti TaxID=519541 RepID=A0AA35XBY1_GEOBA|nr:Deoxyribonuclease-1 [Geodia barretti]